MAQVWTKILLVMIGLLGMTSSFGQDITLKKLYDGIEDMRLQVASRQGSIPDPDPFAQDSLDLRKLLSKNQVKSKQLCNEEIDGPIGNVNVRKIVSGSFTKPETKQRLYTFTRCAFGYGIAILESQKLVAIYDSGQAFDAFAITIVWNVLGGLHPEIQGVLQQRQAFIQTQPNW
jgi:hypothetical protein